MNRPESNTSLREQEAISLFATWNWHEYTEIKQMQLSNNRVSHLISSYSLNFNSRSISSDISGLRMISSSESEVKSNPIVIIRQEDIKRKPGKRISMIEAMKLADQIMTNAEKRRSDFSDEEARRCVLIEDYL